MSPMQSDQRTGGHTKIIVVSVVATPEKRMVRPTAPSSAVLNSRVEVRPRTIAATFQNARYPAMRTKRLRHS